MMFSKRTDWDLKLNRLTQQHHSLVAKGAEILDLTVSNPTQCDFAYSHRPEFFQLLSPHNRYYEPSPNGLHSAREAIAGYYAEKGIGVNPEQIFLASSTSEAYSLLFRLLANPGEAVLAPRPSYPLFDYLATINDIQLHPYVLNYDAAWHSTFDESLFKNTPFRALLVVNPNNPTGSFVKKSELEKIHHFAKKYSFPIMADEVFSDYAFSENSNRCSSFASQTQTLTFTLNGISKSLGMPQMKLGWIVVSGPDALTREATKRLEILLDTFLPVSAPVQNALPEWLCQRRIIQEEIQGRLQQNFLCIEQTLDTSDSLECLPAEGGWYAILRLPKTLSEEEWALTLLEKDHVYAHPGYFFDFDQEAFLVVSLLPPPEIFQKGISRLIARVRELAPA